MSFEPGDTVSDFLLENVHPNIGKSEMNLQDIMEVNGAIIVFSCLHCPYVIGNISRIEKIAEKATSNGVGFVAINSNAANTVYESDSAENTKIACSKGIPYPFLIDSDQSVSASWGAERTPEFYLINNERNVIYRGRLDDSPKNPNLATTAELDDALSQYLAGNKPNKQRTESIGCSIKWVY